MTFNNLAVDRERVGVVQGRTVFVYLVCGAMALSARSLATAEAIGVADGAPESLRYERTVVEPGPDSVSRRWRIASFSQGITRFRYRERDLLGRVVALDSEAGSLPVSEFALRWRGKLVDALPELVVQADTAYVQGQTTYSGFLQVGSKLNPYAARTGNTVQRNALRVGLPLDVLIPSSWARHIAPYAEQGSQRWVRNLTQYGETFSGHTLNFGVMAVLPLAEFVHPRLTRFTLEGSLAIGHSRIHHIAVPTLAFWANTAQSGSRTGVVGLSFDVTPAWVIGFRCVSERSDYASSPTQNGLQYPGSHNSTTRLTASVGYRF